MLPGFLSPPNLLVPFGPRWDPSSGFWSAAQQESPLASGGNTEKGLQRKWTVIIFNTNVDTEGERLNAILASIKEFIVGLILVSYFRPCADMSEEITVLPQNPELSDHF